MPDITAKTIKDLISQRHPEDLVVFECKNGPTMVSHGLGIMDAWVMRSSWSHPEFICYEIKVSRSDFVNDSKWRKYLDECNSFYWVCPSGIIDPAEVPEGTGLIWVAKTGTRLYTKIKAPFRKIDPPALTMQYVLMCRSQVCAPRYGVAPTAEDNRRYWSEWLDQEDSDKKLGHRVGETIQKIVQERIRNVEHENDRLREENKSYAELKELVEEMGLSRSRWQDWKSVVREKLRGTPKQVGWAIDSMRRELDRFETIINDLGKDKL